MKFSTVLAVAGFVSAEVIPTISVTLSSETDVCTETEACTAAQGLTATFADIEECIASVPAACIVSGTVTFGGVVDSTCTGTDVTVTEFSFENLIHPLEELFGVNEVTGRVLVNIGSEATGLQMGATVSSCETENLVAVEELVDGVATITGADLAAYSQVGGYVSGVYTPVAEGETPVAEGDVPNVTYEDVKYTFSAEGTFDTPGSSGALSMLVAPVALFGILMSA